MYMYICGMCVSIRKSKKALNKQWHLCWPLSVFLKSFSWCQRLPKPKPLAPKRHSGWDGWDISTSRTKKYKRCLSPKEFDQTTTTVKFTKRRVVASFPCDKRCLICVWLLPHAAPLSLDTIIFGCGDHAATDMWTNDTAMSFHFVLCWSVRQCRRYAAYGDQILTHSCGHCLLLLILEDNKASSMRLVGRWKIWLHSTSCPLDHWSNPGVLIILIGS